MLIQSQDAQGHVSEQSQDAQGHVSEQSQDAQGHVSCNNGILTLPFHIYDISNHYYIFLCWILLWKWPKKAEKHVEALPLMCILWYLITVQVLDYVWWLVVQQGTWIILQRYHFICVPLNYSTVSVQLCHIRIILRGCFTIALYSLCRKRHHQMRLRSTNCLSCGIGWYVIW
jgi:hypothetical protein